MKKIILYFFILQMLSYSITFSQIRTSKWDLKRCYEFAIQNNISIKKLEIQSQAEKSQFAQSKKLVLPTANFSTTLSDQFGRSLNPATYTFSLQQLLVQNYQLAGSLLLYNFSKITSEKKRRKLTFDLSENEIKANLISLKLKIIQNYLKILLAKEKIKLTEIGLSQTSKQLEITKKQFEAGTSSEINKLQLEAKLSNDSLILVSDNENYNNEILNFKNILNIKETESFEISEIEYDDISNIYILNYSPEFIYKEAFKNLYKSSTDSLKIAIANSAIKSAKSALYPSLSLNYMLASTFSNNIQSNTFNRWFENYGKQLNFNYNYQFNAGLTIPIFNNSTATQNLKLAKISLRDTELKIEEENNELRKQVLSLYTSTKVTLERLSIARRVAEQLKLIYDITLFGYEAGGVNYLDLISSQNSLSKVQEDIIQSKYDVFFKTKILELYLGL